MTVGSVWAQVTPAGAGQSADAPSIRLGVTLYADYSYTQSPETTDADGNVINPRSFNVGRSYINVTGNLSRLVAFRITPDIARETGAASSLNGSYVFRIKYAFAQVNLNDWLGSGSWTRLGIQQTPWLDFAENIYRYRFQGTMFVEREGYFASADAGASFHYDLPSSYGEIHAGVFNGENYNKAEVNDQKAFMVRATVRPFARRDPALRGLRAHVFYDADRYIRNADRTRFIAGATFEHQRVNAGFEYLDTTDRISARPGTPDVNGRGFSIWATPRSPSGWEALLRFDRIEPSRTLGSETRNRTILGVAYWFPHQGNVSSALMLDYDGQTFENVTPAQPSQRRIAVHALVNF